MPKFTRKTVILAKVEATIGTDAVPTGADNAILCDDAPELTPVGDKIERNVVRDSFSPAGHVIGAKEWNLNVVCELKGNDLNTGEPVAPEIEPLLLCCGMKVDTGTSGERKFIPTSERSEQKTATIYFYKDGQLRKLLGCRGSFKVECNVGQIPKITFTIRGLFNLPVDSSNPGTVTTSDMTPAVCTSMGFKVDTYTPLGVTSLGLDLGATLSRRMDVNAAEGVAGIEITGRRPTGSFDPEADTLVNFNPYTAWKDATPAELSATLGSVAGNTVDILVRGAVFEDVRDKDREGVFAYDIPFVATQKAAGDDELELIFK